MWNIKDDNVHYYKPNGAAAVRCDGVHKNVNQQKSLTEKKKSTLLYSVPAVP